MRGEKIDQLSEGVEREGGEWRWRRRREKEEVRGSIKKNVGRCVYTV